jgi:hypothetical protein
MPAVLLPRAYQDWFCPACGAEDRTPALPPDAVRYHTCPRLHSLSAPMLRAGTDASLRATPRADYLGREIQQAGDDGRPYMNVETRYADGRSDVLVFAPVARASFRDD